MKVFTLTVGILFCLNLAAQKLDSLEVNAHGVSYTIKLDDQVHIGYGKNPYGSFQYIEIGSPPRPMDKKYGGRTGQVVKIRYWKVSDRYDLWIKIPKAGIHVAQIPQAIDIGEITGFNDTYFDK